MNKLFYKQVIQIERNMLLKKKKNEENQSWKTCFLKFYNKCIFTVLLVNITIT